MFLELEKKPRDRVALIDDSFFSFTYGDLIEFSDRFSRYSEKRCLVFVLCSNEVGAVAGFYSCIENRVIPLLLDKDMDKRLLDELVAIYRPQYFWCREEFEVKLENTKRVFSDLGYVLLRTKYEKYVVNKNLAMLLPTSGSTGSPKLVRHSYGNIYFSYKTVAGFFGYRESDNGMADLPMQYTMGLSVICSHLYSGAKVTLTNYNLMSPEFWERFRNEGITDFTGVPFSYEIFDRLSFFGSDCPSLRILAEGGGRLSNQLYKKIANYAEKYHKQFFSTFGTTETTARLAFLPPELASDKVGSIGKAIPGGELFLLDEKKEMIWQPDREGELGYKGANVTMGYAETREDLQKGDERKGTYITGDIAKRDEEGCYYILGRSARFLKLYGLRISLDQCERLIRDEFEIDCACSGNDGRMEIYITDASAGDETARFLSDTIHIVKNSFKVHLVKEIPRSSTGKILYKLLGE